MPRPTKVALEIREALRAQGLRTCNTCARTLPVIAFGNYSRGHDGLQVHCRECINVRNKAYNHSAIDRIGRETYSARQREWNRAHRERHPPTPVDYRRRNLSAYRLTLEEFARLSESQGGACAICGVVPEAPKYGKRKALFGGLQVDHDHATKMVRGLLCTHCNVGLGGFGDNEKLLTLAIAYLRKHTKS